MFDGLAMSRLLYVGRIAEPTPDILQLVERGLARTTATPLHALPGDVLGQLDLLGGRPLFKSLEATSMAMRLGAMNYMKKGQRRELGRRGLETNRGWRRRRRLPTHSSAAQRVSPLYHKRRE